MSKRVVYALLEAEGLKRTEHLTYGNTVHRYWVDKNGQHFAIPDEEHCCDSEVFLDILAAIKNSRF